MFIPLAHKAETSILLNDPFRSVRSHPTIKPGLQTAKDPSEPERIFEATQVQKDICLEQIQWATAELPLPTPPPNFQSIVNSWNSLASYHACLRANFFTDPQTGNVLVRVLRQVENIAPAAWLKRVSDDRLAHLVWESTEGGNFKLCLNFRRALLDATAVEMIQTDFLLLLVGLPPLERFGFSSYVRYLQQSKTKSTSQDFWAKTLDNIVSSSLPNLMLFSETSDATHGQCVTIQLGDLIPPYTSDLGSQITFTRKTLFELIWALVLSQHTDSHDVVFVTVGRDDAFIGADSTVGCLNQTNLLRVNVSEDVLIPQLAKAIDNYHSLAARHAFVGINEILRQLPSHKVVESALNYTLGTSLQCLAPGLKKFPIVLTVCDSENPTLTYVDVISKRNAEVDLQQFITGVRHAFHRTSLTHTSLTNIQLVSEKERSNLLGEPFVPAQDDPPSLAKLIETAVPRYASQTAITFEDSVKFTYAELNSLANGLARFLRLKRGGVVSLLMDRSANLCVAILALLKSGVAYTVLNPDMPTERNAQVISECSPTVILADNKYAHMFPLSKSIEQCLEEAAVLATEDNDWNAGDKPSPDDASYIIYTSGSTGKSKGTIVTNRAAANGILHHLSLEGMPRVLLFYSPTASAAQRTFVSTLVHGGTIVIVAKESLAADLAGIINNLRVDVMEITPTAISLLHPSDIPNIKQITIAGENIPQALVDTWAARPDLIVRRRLKPGNNPRVLGAPADTTLAYILRIGSDELTTTGVAGELCLSGPQLASGYLNEPTLTAKAFVPNPFGGEKAYSRLYRTGDRARKFADGRIEILSRIDWQVKINGNKVEPADVDHAIIQLDYVAACATFAADIGGHLSLITAVVPADTERSWSKQLPLLRKHTLNSLPTYMVPNLWMPFYEGLPRSVNGKVDFKQLRAKSSELGVEGFANLATSEDDRDIIATDRVELTIASIWASVIGIPTEIIRGHHSFLALGGNSLQAIKAISKLRAKNIVIDFASFLTDKSLREVTAISRRQDATDAIQTQAFSLIEDSEFLDRLKGQLAVTNAYPATPLQTSLLQTLNEHGDPYIYRRLWDVKDLDFGKLKASFSRVFALRDILRTGFTLHNRSFIQFVREDFSLPWTEAHGSLEEYMYNDGKIDLPLSGPLFRIGLVGNRWLVVTMHHSLCDFWSHGFLYRDVAAAYQGEAIPSRTNFVEFVRFVLQQDTPPARSFWATYLAGAPKSRLNSAPIDRTARVSKDFTLDLHEQAKVRRITAGAVVYTAWAIVLSRHQNSHDVMFATTLSGRDVPVLGVENIDGPTITTVPQRVVIDPQQSLISLAKDVCMSKLAEVARHAQVGMQGALRAANIPSDSFDTLVNLLVKDEAPENVQKVFKQHGERPIWSTPCTLLEVVPEGLQTVVRMSSDMEPRRLQFLCDSFIKVATTILETPEQSVLATDILGEAEKTYLNSTLSNRDALRSPVPQLLHSQFEKRTKMHPQHPAIDWDDSEQVSYASLNKRANHVANLLINRGLQPGDRVALMFEKCVEAIVCIIGALKAGVTYAPLSPENPAHRNAFICHDTSSRLIILQKNNSDLLSHVPGLDAIIIEDVPPVEDEKALPVAVTPDNHAYIIYTSGSTGQPKGIMVPHRSVAAYVESASHREGRFKGNWRTLQMSNFVFDASVLDIFNTLSTGGTLCMAPMDKLLSNLADYMNSMRVRQAALTPTVASVLQPNEVPHLETLILVGEQVSKVIVDNWRPHCRLMNSYGPTETSVVVCSKEIQLDDGLAGNIGRPYPTVMAFILDPDGDSLSPYGAVGELCIAGPQLTDGYLGRDDLTAAAFIQSETLGLRLYRTGDLARWLPGGDIECIGRKDRQIKIHGFRVELGQIESAMHHSGLVADAAVMLVNIHNKPQLVAACVFKSSESKIKQKDSKPLPVAIEPAKKHQDNLLSLQTRLSSLAHYMFPKIVIPMNTLPILRSHKVDRKALERIVEELNVGEISSYVLETASESHQFVATETPVEKAFEMMWADVLGISTSEIGREANFLTLGGDSIAAISLASMARQAGFALGVGTILKTPRLKDLVMEMAVIERDNLYVKPVYEVPQRVKDDAAAAGLNWVEDVEYVYPVPSGQVEFPTQGSHKDQLWVLHTVRRMPSTADRERWITSTIELTKVDDILRASWLQVSHTEWAGLVFRSPDINLTQVSCLNEEEAAPIIEATWNERFVFGQPFIRYTIINYPDGDWDLVTKMDHAVYDGTLLRIFDDHYGPILRGQPVPRHTEFRDFAFHIFEEDHSKSLIYWSKRMDRWDEAARHNQASWAKATAPCTNAVIKRPLSTSNVDQVANTLGVTPSIFFQGAFQVWLARATGTHDVGFDYLLTGRNVNLPEPQTINGTVANFLPVRVKISPEVLLSSFLTRVQDDFWAMTDHGDVGLDDIYGAARLDRQQVGNRALFIFQPFEPAPRDDPNADFRWLIMAKCKVRMPAPYALVVEVHKAPDNAHSLKMSYDQTIIDTEKAGKIADDITEIVNKMMDLSGSSVKKRVTDI